MKIAKYNLRVGGKVGQEGKEEKLRLGREYVEILKRDGEVILSVEETEKEIIITME